MPSSPHRAGLVSLLGRPNAGKSTLLNRLLGEKLSIVSSRPQTTRTIVQGVLTLPEAQIVFLDTPGIHKTGTLLNKRMMGAVREAAEGRDLLLYVADATRGPDLEESRALDLVKRTGTPVLLVLNQIDRLRDKLRLLPRMEQFRALHDFARYVPISALTGDGLDVLQTEIVGMLPEGPPLYPPDYLTDQPERFRAAEIIREKVIQETRQEVPHSIAVLVDNWEETPRLLRLAATVYVERAGQKGIVIGARGAMLKKIGAQARVELESLFSRKLYLELAVRERPGWREDQAFVNALDWRSGSGTE